MSLLRFRYHCQGGLEGARWSRYCKEKVKECTYRSEASDGWLRATKKEDIYKRRVYSTMIYLQTVFLLNQHIGIVFIRSTKLSISNEHIFSVVIRSTELYIELIEGANHMETRCVLRQFVLNVFNS